MFTLVDSNVILDVVINDAVVLVVGVAGASGQRTAPLPDFYIGAHVRPLAACNCGRAIHAAIEPTFRRDDCGAMRFLTPL